MELAINKDEKTGLINFGFITFNSGKKVILTKEEVEEVLYKFEQKTSEGKIIGNTIHHETLIDEFYLTGAYATGIELGAKKYLLVTRIEDDIFCNGTECNNRIEKNYGL